MEELTARLEGRLAGLEAALSDYEYITGLYDREVVKFPYDTLGVMLQARIKATKEMIEGDFTIRAACEKP